MSALPTHSHPPVYWQALQMLERDFIRACTQGPFELVATPYDDIDVRALVDVVDAQIQLEADGHTLGEMLRILARLAAREDDEAQRLISRMARTHAAYYASLMDEAGDFA